MKPHQVQWGGSETVTTVEQLDALLDRLHSQALGELPMLVAINGPKGSLMIGLGHSESVLTFTLPDSDPPYLVSTNKSKDQTQIDFFMQGHHSRVMAKHLVSMDVARSAVRVFVEQGALSCDVRWSEV
jgi:hypothetical protein